MVRDLMAELSRLDPLREVVVEVVCDGGFTDTEALTCPKCDHVLPPTEASGGAPEKRRIEHLRHDLRHIVIEAADEEVRLS